MTVEQIDQALFALVARQRAKMTDRLIARLKEESEAGEDRYDEAEPRLEDAQEGSAREAATDPGFRA